MQTELTRKFEAFLLHGKFHGGPPSVKTMQPCVHLTIVRSSGAKEPLRLRFLDDVEFDEDDLWDYDHLVTSSGDPRAVVADVDPSGPA